MSVASLMFPDGVTFERVDQGQDIETKPGAAVIAPWAGTISLAHNPDPSGFGDYYPIYTPSEGPAAGHALYIGHTIAAVAAGPVKAGQTIAHTGYGQGGAITGNANTPGWAEVGYWGTSGPTGQGQAAAQLLHSGGTSSDPFALSPLGAAVGALPGIGQALTAVPSVANTVGSTVAGIASDITGGAIDAAAKAGAKAAINALWDAIRGSALKALLYLGLIGGGVWLMDFGIARMFGTRPITSHIAAVV